MENNDKNVQGESNFSTGQNRENLGSASNLADNNNLANSNTIAVNSGGKKKQFLFFALAIFIILIGATVFYFVSQASPQKIIKSSVLEMKKLKTVAFDGVIGMNFQISENKKQSSGTLSKTENDTRALGFNNMSMKIAIKLNGKEDMSDLNNPKEDSNIKIQSGVSVEGGSQDFSADMNLTSLDNKKLYFKLNDYDLGSLGFVYAPILNPFKGNWYYLDMEKATKMNPVAMAEMSELNKKIMQSFGKYEFINFKKDLGDDKIGNTAVYHYEVILDRKEVVNFYLDIVKEFENMARKRGTFNDKNNQDIVEFKSKIEQSGDIFDDIFNQIKTEVWIGKKDKMMRRITLNGKFDENFNKTFFDKSEKFIGEENEFSETTDMQSDFSMDFSFTDFNKQIVIEAPPEAVDFQEAIAKTTENAFNNPPTTPLEPEVADTDKDGLTDDLEKIYKTNPTKPDTDGDGYKDGDEVKNGFDPLNKTKGAKLKKGSF